MDLYTVQSVETGEPLASDMDACNIDDLLDWFCYTKPLGADIKVVARPTVKGEPVFCVHAVGNKPDLHSDS